MKTTTTRLLFLSLIFCLGTHLAMGQDMVALQPNFLSRAVNQLDWDAEYQRIGNFKVRGNFYLLKGANVSDIFTPLGFGVNMPLVFDAYTQNVGIMQEDRKSIVPLSLKELDSFVVKVDNENRFYKPATFINASKIDPAKKFYLERLVHGAKYGLYKSYNAEMRKTTVELAQTNVMEFEMVSEYFYLTSGATEFIRIKSNLSTLKKQFGLEKEALELLHGTTKTNLQENLTVFFNTLNSKK